MHTLQYETAVCGGSNLKAPMKLDFLRSLCVQERHMWPEVVLHRCFQIAAAADGDLILQRMHISFRLSQLPRTASHGNPFAPPW